MYQEFFEVIDKEGHKSIHPADNIESVKRMLAGKIQKIKKCDANGNSLEPAKPIKKVTN